MTHKNIETVKRIDFDRLDILVSERTEALRAEHRQGRWRRRFDAARRKAAEQAADEAMAERIRRFQFRDIRPKAASELPVEHASRLLGHSEKEITERVYRRLGEVVKPTK